MAKASGGQIKKKKGDAGAAKNYIVRSSVLILQRRARLISAYRPFAEPHSGHQEAPVQHIRLSQAVHPQGSASRLGAVGCMLASGG